MEKKNIDRYMLLKNVTENLKNLILCLKKSEKSEHFYVTHEHFLKKLALFQHFFGKKRALLLAFNAFFTSTFGKSLAAVMSSRIEGDFSFFACRFYHFVNHLYPF